jgi:hypothetical protein
MENFWPERMGAQALMCWISESKSFNLELETSLDPKYQDENQLKLLAKSNPSQATEPNLPAPLGVFKCTIARKRQR